MNLLSNAALSVWFLAAGMISLASGAEPAGQFPLRNGDVWVMAGDSITAQHLHSNYFEAFCFARYPELTFAFRNSGVGGHTIPSTLARFDYDVAAWKPTVISVELGMNDAGRFSREEFLKNMNTWLERVKSVPARPVIFTPSAVNDGSLLATLAKGNRNVRLNEYSLDLKTLAEQEHLPFADQFHTLIDRWGKNTANLQIAELMGPAKAAAANNAIPGVEHLREFLKAQTPPAQAPVSLQGNPVHPGPCGQLMMAAVLLKGLGADGFVSSVALDAHGKNVTAKGCQVTNVNAEGNQVAFVRLDERLPFPVPADAAAVLPLTPEVLELSQYSLQLTGLPSGNYQVQLNEILVAAFTAEQLAHGVNLTPYAPGILPEPRNPLLIQSAAILKAVAAKESLVSQWRGISKSAAATGADPKLKGQLPGLQTRIEEADAAIRVAARPQKLIIQVLPAPETPAKK